MTLDQLSAVLDHLRSQQRYHELDGQVLVVQSRDEAEVRALLAGAAPALPGEFPVVAAAAVRRRRHAVALLTGYVDLASRTARFFGAVIDSLLYAVAWQFLWRGIDGDRLGLFVGDVGYWTFVTVTTAVYGWSPGKLLVRTRVVGPDGAAPGWAGGVIRVAATFVPSAAGVAVAQVWLPAVAVLLAMGGTVAVFVGILVRADRRGLHDLAAGTTVVRARAIRRSAARA